MRRRAFSLVEILVGAALAFLIVGLALYFLQGTGQAVTRAVIRGEMQQQAVLALNRLVLDYGRSSPDGISCSSAAPRALAICQISQPDLGPAQPPPNQPDGTVVWSNFFVIYYFDSPSGQLRRREWPQGSVPATPEETVITKARRLTPARISAVLAGTAPREIVVAAAVKDFTINYPPGGSDAILVQPVSFTLKLERTGNTGHQEPERFVYQRTAFVRNQK